MENQEDKKFQNYLGQPQELLQTHSPTEAIEEINRQQETPPYPNLREDQSHAIKVEKFEDDPGFQITPATPSSMVGQVIRRSDHLPSDGRVSEEIPTINEGPLSNQVNQRAIEGPSIQHAHSPRNIETQVIGRNPQGETSVQTYTIIKAPPIIFPRPGPEASTSTRRAPRKRCRIKPPPAPPAPPAPPLVDMQAVPQAGIPMTPQANVLRNPQPNIMEAPLAMPYPLPQAQTQANPNSPVHFYPDYIPQPVPTPVNRAHPAPTIQQQREEYDRIQWQLYGEPWDRFDTLVDVAVAADLAQRGHRDISYVLEAMRRYLPGSREYQECIQYLSGIDFRQALAAQMEGMAGE
ncbi:hypothetical protein AA313_de0209622 [Arthrobotrys entomopaga]|nr:hypothetical protein AA313_de0209622 [Arthrobotrys entomopaga]